MEIGDNTILFTMNQKKMVFKPYNMLNTLATTDVAFCERTQAYINQILKKSIPLSTSSEKERSKFFNSMEQKVQMIQNKVTIQLSTIST